MRYPSVLYETPWEWAVTREAFWISATELKRTLADLRRNLGWEYPPESVASGATGVAASMSVGKMKCG
jgi:hypothetical protein